MRCLCGTRQFACCKKQLAISMLYETLSHVWLVVAVPQYFLHAIYLYCTYTVIYVHLIYLNTQYIYVYLYTQHTNVHTISLTLFLYQCRIDTYEFDKGDVYLFFRLESRIFFLGVGGKYSDTVYFMGIMF